LEGVSRVPPNPLLIVIETFSSPILKQLTDALPESQHLMEQVERNVAAFVRELEELSK
jgi:hypothetical protein